MQLFKQRQEKQHSFAFSSEIMLETKFIRRWFHLYNIKTILYPIKISVVKYWDLFVEKNVDIKTMKNKSGETPFDLMKQISDRLNAPKFDKVNDCPADIVQCLISAMN